MAESFAFGPGLFAICLTFIFFYPRKFDSEKNPVIPTKHYAAVKSKSSPYYLNETFYVQLNFIIFEADNAVYNDDVLCKIA